jgi:hypothetical protein
VGLVLAVLLTGLAAVLLREDPSTGDCAVQVSAGEVRDQLVPRDDLLPAGSEGDARREVVEAVEGLGGPVGQVATGRFFERLTERPSVLAYDDRLALVTAPTPGGAAVEVVDPDTAETDWRVELAGDPAWTRFTGGPVGSDLVLAFTGPAPTLLTLADDSAPVGCRALARPDGFPVEVRTDQAAEDVVVATVTGSQEREVRLLDPVGGDGAWTHEGQGRLASVTVAGDLVLLARADTATTATEGLPRPAGGPWLEALSSEDGSARWELAGGPTTAWVLLTAGPDATSYLLRVGGGPTRLVAVDDRGEERWARRVPRGFTSASLWEDRLVLRGPDPSGGPMLRAFDTATGAPTWSVRADQAPSVGDGPRPGFGTALVEDGTAWLPAPNGLLEVDVASGRATRHDSTARVDELLRVGDPLRGGVAVLSGAALLFTR